MLAILIAATGTLPSPICTDRPTKANAVCTVPAGMLQLESSAFGWGRHRDGGMTMDTYSAGSTVFKYGLTPRSDLQIAVVPYLRIESDGDEISGFGDVTFRYKHSVTGDDSTVQVALIPFAKVPTAKRGIGNGKLEGGLAVPFSAFFGAVTLTLGPELDLLADADGDGRHVALVNLVNVAGTIAPRLTLVGELWSNLNFDPAGTIKQASADAALVYALSTNAQLDLGANLGLTGDTSDVEIYVGISLRH
jgi:hypothetical protein